MRDRIRPRPGLAQLRRVGVFAAGLLCVAIGLARAVLPGPLTIPPVLLGLWVWSTEFDWARRFFLTFRSKAQATWKHAKQHPLSSALTTGAGLVGVAVDVWAVGHFALVDRVMAIVDL